MSTDIKKLLLKYGILVDRFGTAFYSKTPHSEKKFKEFLKREFWVVLRGQGAPKSCRISTRYKLDDIIYTTPDVQFTHCFKATYTTNMGNQKTVSLLDIKVYDDESEAYREYIRLVTIDLKSKEHQAWELQTSLDYVKNEIERLNNEIDNYAAFI